MGVTKPISSVPLFSEFFIIVKHTLAIEYHLYIWQVSPQPSCGDTCQIWMWFKEYSRYFCKMENLVYGEINEWRFSNPHQKQTTGERGIPSQLCWLEICRPSLYALQINTELVVRPITYWITARHSTVYLVRQWNDMDTGHWHTFIKVLNIIRIRPRHTFFKINRHYIKALFK